MPRSRRPPENPLLDHTIAVFEPRAGRRLSREDAREIQHNLTGFFRVLLEWDARARRQAEEGRDG
jgi:hypothetical protein